MTPEEKADGNAYMENHVKLEDTLRRDLKELDDEKPVGMPSVYKEGEVISLEDLRKELTSVKDWALSEIDRSKDMAPTVNQIIFKYLSLGDELKKQTPRIKTFRDDDYIHHLGLLNLFLLKFRNTQVND